MERIHRIAFGLDECASFITSFASGLSEGSEFGVDCDHKDVYFTEDAFNRNVFDENMPIPMLINLIDLNDSERNDLITKLSEGLKTEGQKLSRYLEFAKPFLEFEHHDKDYQVTKGGLIVARYQEIVPASLNSISLSDWATHDIGLNVEMYFALSNANHQRFTRQFRPHIFERIPEYGRLKEPEKKLIGEFVASIKSDDPVTAMELEALIQ